MEYEKEDFPFKYFYNCITCLRGTLNNFQEQRLVVERRWEGKSRTDRERERDRGIEREIVRVKEKEGGREEGRERGWERKWECCIFCVKESFFGLSTFSLVLSCMADTPNRITFFHLETVRFTWPLSGKHLKLEKNYSCQRSLTLSMVISFLFLKILGL